MRPLKIALLARSYWQEHHYHGTEEGGAVQQLAEAVAALGHEVVVLSQSPEVRALKKAQVGKLETWLSPSQKPRDILTGIRDKIARKKFHHPKIYSDVLSLRDFLKKRRPFDVLWAQKEDPDGLVAAVAAQLKIKLPPMLVQVQSLRHHFSKGAPVFDGKPILLPIFRRASRILINSDIVAGCLPSFVGTGSASSNCRRKSGWLRPIFSGPFFKLRWKGPPGPSR